MSDLESKFEQRRVSVGGKAQARRSQLLARWGSREGSITEGKDLIIIDTLGGREVWRRVSGDVFEQEKRS